MKNVEKAIRNNIHNQKAIFVFPTDVSATSWAEFSLEIEDVEAISSERFIAWDKFKSKSIRSQMQDKNSIPSVLRKFFAQDILERNKTENLFSTIINRDYLQTSNSFTDWIAGVLPQLQVWEESVTKQSIIDDEDKDFQVLKNEYADFLEKNNLFDPAWERPPFNNDGFTYFIAYPEILTDYAEYKDILETTECIEIIPIDNTVEKQEVLQYTNTRSELRETALFIRNLVETTGIQYNDIALSIKDLATLEPYITREFELYNIPFKLRSGKNLSEYPAGKLFNLINDCYTEQFSFETVKNLVLDGTFPWKEPGKSLKLVEFGIKNNCVCKYDNKDIWLSSFKNHYEEEAFYKKLTKNIINLVESKTFADVLKYYNTFKNDFFHSNNFTDQANIIISRCVVELDAIVKLEKDYPEATKIQKPYAFFVELLAQKDYVPQNKNVGVNIFSYRIASCALFKQHIIFDSSQNSLTVTEKRLSFIQDDKRKQLGIQDENTSQKFVDLYTLHSDNTVQFTCSKKTFNGYAIPFNGLTTIELEKTPEYSLAKNLENLYSIERDYVLGNTSSIEKLHSIQKDGFTKWNCTKNQIQENSSFVELIKNKIDQKLIKENLLQISATTLNAFYECPVKWLCERILKIEDTTLEATVVDNVFIGTFYHKILELYFKQNKKVEVTEDNEIPSDAKILLANITKEILAEFPESCEIKNLSDLTIEIFKTHEDVYIQNIIKFVNSFSKTFNGSTVLDSEKQFSIPFDDYSLAGKIDCILDFPGNRYIEAGVFIVDFKLKNMPKRKNCIKTSAEDVQDFQIPLYTYALEFEKYNNSEDIVGGGFGSILNTNFSPMYGILEAGTKANPNTTKDRLIRNEPNSEGIDFKDTMAALQTAIKGFKNCILDKDLSLFTNSDKWGTFPNGKKVPFDTCRKCEYKKYCRTIYTVEGAR